MGKLGARELDYHSDLDLIFVWDESFGGAGAESPVEAATALAEKMVEQLTTATPEGRPYEVDARLRPEGQNAPLAPPFGRYEEYFAGRAQPWEFQSAMQLRPIAGDAALGERLRRALGGIVARRVAEIDLKKEIRAMRRRIEENLKPPRWAFCDFKKGIGGLLDPAFVAQYLQLRHLAGDPALIGLGPHAAMNRLVARGKVEQTFGERFATGYIWLRRIERRTRRLLGSDRSVIPNGGERLEALERACRSLLGPGENLRDRMALELRNNRAMYGEVLGE
jgi:glutamate-ammonia-ligase adenylyltransferase